eukprot:1101092-Pleurochrysis_carterae.AAC.4
MVASLEHRADASISPCSPAFTGPHSSWSLLNEGGVMAFIHIHGLASTGALARRTDARECTCVPTCAGCRA